MKRHLLLLLSLLFVSAIAVGCSEGNAETTGSNSSTGSEEGEEPKEVYIFHPKVEIADQLEAMAAEFEEEYTDIDIRLEALGGGADYRPALKAKFSSGEEPDIFINGGFTELELWKEHLADLSDEPWVEHVLPIGKEPMTDSEGKLYGMPINLEGYGIVYNKKLFEEAGITEKPTTLSELKEAAQKLENSGITAFAAGYGEYWIPGEHLINVPFAKQDDSASFIQGLNEGTTSIVGNESFEQFKEYIDIELAYANDNPLTTDYNTQVTLFASGETAMLAGQGNWTEAMIYEIDPEMDMSFLSIPLSDEADEDLLPVGVPNNWAVNKNSENVEAAKTFLNWMVSSETGQQYITEQFKFIPAFDNIEPTGIGALGESILEYSKAGKTIPWTFYKFPSGASHEFGSTIQSYAAGNIDYETVLEQFQATWDSLKE
ncbi:ABC transporter substrate-binding protein [Aquibacillus albus]|uniref:Raffinose/stachyose/melibiose transport system substrate-binding protein n=1 Tax=Aquibacillus albus TaxID=1168171 RepID=A0ABS2MWK2_9BACI|nr:ABC transporter substrate-binding protein [Aquibacillus albus]MBM7570168.1 raffinose/stachyose/melibiose transport system substrate-binding protein [Aquibacillus albus]